MESNCETYLISQNCAYSTLNNLSYIRVTTDRVLQFLILIYIADVLPAPAGAVRLPPLGGQLPPPHPQQAAPPLRRQVGRRGRPQAQGLPQGAQEGQEKGTVLR